MMEDVSRLLKSGKEVVLSVSGKSMLPFVKDGDRVELSAVDSYNIGDVVLARTVDGMYVIHRIIRVHEEFVILMGDGNLCQQETCKYVDLVAKVKVVIKANGRRIRLGGKKYLIIGKIWVKLLHCRRWLLAIYRLFYED